MRILLGSFPLAVSLCPTHYVSCYNKQKAKFNCSTRVFHVKDIFGGHSNGKYTQRYIIALRTFILYVVHMQPSTLPTLTRSSFALLTHSLHFLSLSLTTTFRMVSENISLIGY